MVATVLSCGIALAAEPFTIHDAINQAVQTNPGVGEAAANRRATESELGQTQSTLLPQVRVEGRWGAVRSNQLDVIPAPQGNGTWLRSAEGSLVARQLLFDGFATLNEIWRQTARVDAAAYRVRERTELIALDASEAYIDVIRYSRLVALATENVAAHRRILSNVDARFRGGRAGEGDLQQVRERVEAAEATRAQFKQQYDEARAKFRKVIGIEPFNLRTPGRLRGLPPTKDESLAIALRHNPTIQAAESDKDAAKYAFHATAGAFAPTVALEGRALDGFNSGGVFGRRTDFSGMVVATWDIFRGGQDLWKRNEMAERYTEQTMRHARLQRDAYESIDKAWAARTITSERIDALVRQIRADRLVIDAYTKEYDLGQRSLIDLLNAQNQLFNALVSLESTRGVAVFADYQLLAAVGTLLEYLKAPHPVDAEPLETKPFGLFPPRLSPIRIWLPEPGSEPLNVRREAAYVVAPAPARPLSALALGQQQVDQPQAQAPESGFEQRWPQSGQSRSWLEAMFAPLQENALQQPQPKTAPQQASRGNPSEQVQPEDARPQPQQATPPQRPQQAAPARPAQQTAAPRQQKTPRRQEASSGPLALDPAAFAAEKPETTGPVADQQ